MSARGPPNRCPRGMQSSDEKRTRAGAEATSACSPFVGVGRIPFVFRLYPSRIRFVSCHSLVVFHSSSVKICIGVKNPAKHCSGRARGESRQPPPIPHTSRNPPGCHKARRCRLPVLNMGSAGLLSFKLKKTFPNPGWCVGLQVFGSVGKAGGGLLACRRLLFFSC
jgi:hypothetical protein